MLSYHAELKTLKQPIDGKPYQVTCVLKGDDWEACHQWWFRKEPGPMEFNIFVRLGLEKILEQLKKVHA
jgi:hypothetical protein